MALLIPLVAMYGTSPRKSVAEPPVNVPEPVKQPEQANVAGITEMSLEPHTQSKSEELLQALQSEEPQHESSVPPPPPFFKQSVQRAHQAKRRRR